MKTAGTARAVIEMAASGSRTKVLIVEDDEMVRDYAQLVVSALGYEPVTAGDGKAALRALDENGDIVLLLTDVGLPGMSGPALYRNDQGHFNGASSRQAIVSGLSTNRNPPGLPPLDRH